MPQFEGRLHRLWRHYENTISATTPTTKTRNHTKRLPDDQRFLNNVSAPTTANGCWLWKTTCFSNGYGQFNVHGTCVYAHRYAWELHNKQAIPAGKMVLHSVGCTDRRCCNPAHLRIGDAKANALDRIKCGRSGKGLPKVKAFFTDAEKATIARLHLEGLSQYAIAKQLNRAQPAIAYQINKYKATVASKLRKKAASITAAVTELSAAITDLYGEPEHKKAA